MFEGLLGVRKRYSTIMIYDEGKKKNYFQAKNNPDLGDVIGFEFLKLLVHTHSSFIRV